MIITKKPSIHQFPLKQDAGQRYLSWTVGLLSIIMVFILTGFFAFYDPYTEFGSDPNFTIEIPLLSESTTQSKALVEKVVVFLKTVPTLQKIEILEKGEMLKLLEPYVNDTQALKDLKLPVFIDVTLDNPEAVDIRLLTHQMRQIAAGIHIEPYSRWQDMSKIQNHTFQGLAVGCLVLILVIMMMLVSLVTKTSLMAYQSIVDILRLMGAKTAFIARQFQTQAFTSCLKGGFAGLIFGLVILYILSFIPHFLEAPAFLKGLLRFQLLPLFLLMPFTTALISVVVARLTVSRLLYNLEQ